MKKIILLFILFNSVIGIAQPDTNHKPDVAGRIMLTELKKQDVFSSEVRDLLISETNKIKAKSSDLNLLADCDSYIKYLENTKTAEAVKVNLDLIPSDFKKKIKVSHDKFKKRTIITPKNAYGDRLSLAINVNNDDFALLVLRNYYKGKDWRFITRAEVLIGNESFNYKIKDVERETSLGYVEEISSEYVNEELLDLLRSIINSTETVSVRFSGDKGNYDFDLHKSEIKTLADMLFLYDTIRSK